MWGWGEGKDGVDMIDCCRPLKVEVYQLQDDSILKDWKPPETPAYKGMHGLKIPSQL